MTAILIFGDSLTWGAWDEKGGWAQRLRNFIEKKYPTTDENAYFTYNLGIPGEKTPYLLERIESETEQRINEKEKEIIFIFQIGGNDAAWKKEKNQNNTEKEQFKKNIEELIKRARKYSNKIIFLGTIQHDETRCCPISFNKNLFFYNKYQNEYNEIIKETCKKNKVHFVELINLFKVNNIAELMSEDGTHPNSRGHELIYNAVKDYIIKNKIF